MMLTPIKHEDIDNSLLNDAAYLFGSHLSDSVDETTALIPPNLRVNSSKREPQVMHRNAEKVSHHDRTKHLSLTNHLTVDKKMESSPRFDMRLHPDLEKTMLAAQGKLAYVSPTVRQSNNTNRHTFHGSTSQTQKSGGSLGFVTRQSGGSMSQLSPAQPQLQLGQPTVLLNPGSQVDLHR